MLLNKKNNSTVYFPVNDIFCKVIFYNFLLNNYSIENPILEVSYYKLDGNFLDKERYILKDNETIIIDSKVKALEQGFKDDLFLEFSLLGFPEEIKGIARVFADYYTNKGLITSVHEQGAFWDSKYSGAMAQGNMNIIVNEDITTYVLVQNTYTKEKPIQISIRVYNNKGKYKEVYSGDLKYKELNLIDIDPTNELNKFLNGTVGNAVVIYSEYVGRVSYLQRTRKNKDLQYISISHGTYYNLDELRGHNLSDYSFQNETILSYLLLFNVNEMYSCFTFFNDYPEDAFYSLIIYNQYGEIIKEIDQLFILKQNEIKQIEAKQFSDFLEEGFIGLASFKVKFKDTSPLYSDMSYEIIKKNYRSNMQLAGSASLNNNKSYEELANKNLTQHTVLNKGTFHRSRQFGRAYVNHHKYKSYFFISLSSSSKEIINKSCNTKVIFITADGNKAVTKYIQIPINGVYFEDINILLKEECIFKKSDVVSVYLRDPYFKLISSIMIEDISTGDIAMDHFVGA
jgi:hypothetical protein